MSSKSSARSARGSAVRGATASPAFGRDNPTAVARAERPEVVGFRLTVLSDQRTGRVLASEMHPATDRDGADVLDRLLRQVRTAFPRLAESRIYSSTASRSQASTRSKPKSQPVASRRAPMRSGRRCSHS